MRDIYEILADISIRHDYFEQGVCTALELVSAPETTKQLARGGFLWRKVSPGRWNLLGREQDVPVNMDDMSFYIRISDPLFFHYTDCGKTIPNPMLFVRAKNTSHRKETGIPLETPFLFVEKKHPQIAGEIILPSTGFPFSTTLILQAKHLYWEYILFPRNGKTDRDIFIEDNTGGISFTRTEPVTAGTIQALRIRSQAPVAVKKQYPAEINLYERTPYGKKLLQQRLDCPQPGRFISQEDKKEDLLTQWIYF